MDNSNLRSRTPLRTSLRKYHRRNLYVAKKDLDIWQRADEYCEHENVSISSLIATALGKFLEENVN